MEQRQCDNCGLLQDPGSRCENCGNRVYRYATDDATKFTLGSHDLDLESPDAEIEDPHPMPDTPAPSPQDEPRIKTFSVPAKPFIPTPSEPPIKTSQPTKVQRRSRRRRTRLILVVLFLLFRLFQNLTN